MGAFQFENTLPMKVMMESINVRVLPTWKVLGKGGYTKAPGNKLLPKGIPIEAPREALFLFTRRYVGVFPPFFFSPRNVDTQPPSASPRDIFWYLVFWLVSVL